MSKRIEDLTDEAQAKCREFLQANVAAGHPLLLVFTFRSFEEQEFLYASGRDRPGPIVTNARAGESWHNYRCAWDCAFLMPGGMLSWKGPWEDAGRLAEGLGILWGGRFKSIADLGHFEYHPGVTLADMQAKTYVPKFA